LPTDEWKYVLDANVFIEAKNRFYSFDIAPPFWDALRHLALSGRICSVDRVKDDLGKKKDPLRDWANNHFVFCPTNTVEVVSSYRAAQQWVADQPQYTEYARSEFARGSDAYVIAYAHAYSYVVVTQETPSPNAKKRVKIPDVCSAPAFGLRCVDVFQMLRELNVRFSSFTAQAGTQ